VERGIEFEPLSDDRDEHVGADGDPYLRVDGVFRGAEEGLDSQVLLDPTKEQLDLPAGTIELNDGHCGQSEAIGQEDQSFPTDRICESNPSKLTGIVPRTELAREDDDLIADETARAINLSRITTLGFGVRTRTRNEERACLANSPEPREVEIGPVEHIVSAGLDNELIEYADVVYSALANRQKGWNWASY
jgi:hypothetical protein